MLYLQFCARSTYHYHYCLSIVEQLLFHDDIKCITTNGYTTIHVGTDIWICYMTSNNFRQKMLKSAKSFLECDWINQNVTLGLFHCIGPAKSYTHTLPILSPSLLCTIFLPIAVFKRFIYYAQYYAHAWLLQLFHSLYMILLSLMIRLA